MGGDFDSYATADSGCRAALAAANPVRPPTARAVLARKAKLSRLQHGLGNGWCVQYRILAKPGEGGMPSVYKTMHTPA